MLSPPYGSGPDIAATQEGSDWEGSLNQGIFIATPPQRVTAFASAATAPRCARQNLAAKGPTLRELPFA